MIRIISSTRRASQPSYSQLGGKGKVARAFILSLYLQMLKDCQVESINTLVAADRDKTQHGNVKVYILHSSNVKVSNAPFPQKIMSNFY